MTAAAIAAAPAFAPSHPDSRLAADWLYLHAKMPPAKWPALPSFGAAASWLGMHASLRKGQGEDGQPYCQFGRAG